MKKRERQGRDAPSAAERMAAALNGEDDPRSTTWAREQIMSHVRTVEMPSEPDFVEILRDDEFIRELLTLNDGRYRKSSFNDSEMPLRLRTGPAQTAYLYWSQVLSNLDSTEWREPASRYVGLEIVCPGCGKRLVLVGLDRDQEHAGSDRVWYRTRRRVTATWRGVDESYDEGHYLSSHRLDVDCPVPTCRGKVEWRVPRIVLTLHRLRKELETDERESVILSYVP